MRSATLPTLVVLVLFLAPASRAAPGLRLSWDQCAADGRVATRTFACDTNAGEELLIGSFEPAVASGPWSSIEFVLDVTAADAALPTWWAFHNVGFCRESSLQWLTAPPGSSACPDPYQGQGVGGIAAYNVGFSGPNTVRILAVTAVPQASAFSVEAGVEYFAFGLRMDHAGTVGSSGCAGCDTTVCIGLAKLDLVSSVTGEQVAMLGGGETTVVNWQGGRASFSVSPDLLGPNGIHSELSCLSQVVPVRKSTWAQVRARYR